MHAAQPHEITMSDTVYNIKLYYHYTWEEIIGYLVTSIFGGFILTFNEWGSTSFNAGAGLRAFASMAIFLLVMFFCVCSFCKLLGVRLGYQMHYQPHLVGLMAGLVITVASAGYLPLFLPGGFKYHKPWRMYVGHWRGYHRPWEVAMLAGLFPLLMLSSVLILSPLYISSGSEILYRYIVAMCLVAVFALIPLPNIALEYGGRVTDFFRYLKGMTFGLDVYMNSRTWFAPLTTFVLLFAVLAYILTRVGTVAAFWIYALAWIPALIVLYIYKSFYDQAKLGGTFR
jgi:hypothetical protein